MRDIKKYSFPYRTLDIWNGLNGEIVNANNIYNLKEKLDKIRYGDKHHEHN